MADSMALLSGLCIVCTVGMFSTGLTDLHKMFTARSVDNIQFLPFLTTDISVMGWFYYGYLKGDWTLMTVNAIGMILQTLYILVYLTFTPEKAKIVQMKSAKCLSFPLTVGTFLASTSWVLYGLQLNDLYITVPNLPGILTSIVRFWLFWQYPAEKETLPYRQLQA